jgi:hypothetical protein
VEIVDRCALYCVESNADLSSSLITKTPRVPVTGFDTWPGESASSAPVNAGSRAMREVVVLILRSSIRSVLAPFVPAAIVPRLSPGFRFFRRAEPSSTAFSFLLPVQRHSTADTRETVAYRNSPAQ